MFNMKKICYLFFICLFAANILFTACDQPSGASSYSSSINSDGNSTNSGGNSTNSGGNSASSRLYSLQDYKNVGASVAAKKGSTNYDCSNFSAQFYQNCFNKGLPCRVRLGKAGGSNFPSNENHAWNSVKINGEWVNWEPQLNDVYRGHTQTRTSSGLDGDFVLEDVVRILYEMVGKYVPENVIDRYELDRYMLEDSPFYQYYYSKAYCLSDDTDQSIQEFISVTLQGTIKKNNSGSVYISGDNQHLIFFFKYRDKYYGMLNIETADPVEGRSVTKTDKLKEIIDSGNEFIELSVDLRYGFEKTVQ